MALKLIKEAQIVTSLAEKDLSALRALQEHTGKPLHILAEGFAPTPEDYAQWLDVIKGYAADEGININKRNAFADIAGAVLENDPAMPSIEMQGAIIKQLWQHFKLEKQQAQVDKIAQAHEEEERVRHAARNLMRSTEDEEYGGIRAPNYQDKNAWDASEEGGEGADNRVGDAERFGKMGGHPNKRMGYEGGYPYGPGSEDEERGEYALSASELERRKKEGWRGDSLKTPTKDDVAGSNYSAVDVARDTKTLFRGSEDEEYGAHHQAVRKLNAILDRQLYRKNDPETIQARQRLGSQENEEDMEAVDREDEAQTIQVRPRRSLPLSAKSPRTGEVDGSKWVLADTDEDEEKAKKAASGKTPEDVAHAILTAPREIMRNATKGIKDEGADAWKNHGLPKNPHPIKSAAHKHWRQGMIKAALADLGINTTQPEAKPKRK